MPTPKRKEYLNFTTSYLDAPLVMATRSDVAFVSELEDLSGKRLAIPKGMLLRKFCKTNIQILIS
jgi:polar amino acid transport system substrate-binding protein